MTAQEIFNRVWDHFVTKKNPRSINPDSLYCCYRGPEGARCAVGVLIPDELYRRGLENYGTIANMLSCMDPDTVAVHYQPEECYAANAFFDELRMHNGLLMALQRAHDFKHEDPIEARLRDVAQLHHLEIPA